MRTAWTLWGIVMLGAGAAWGQPQIDLDLPPAAELGLAGPQISGPVDDRFFGTFCQTEKKRFCKDVRWAPDPCADVEDLRIQIDHVLTSRGSQLAGRGTFRLDGKRAILTVAGAVTAPRTARFAASVPGLGRQRGDAWITPNGLKLTITAMDRSVELRKDACGNDPPRVSLNLVGGPEFPYRRTISMGTSIDDEDDGQSFPEDRIQFTSDRQGPIQGFRANFNRFLSTSKLLPGRHRVTVRVVDSGGLVGSDSVDLVVTNRPPVASIEQPLAASSVPATVPVFLRGSGHDPEEGVLPGHRLRWEAQQTPGGDFESAGSGNRSSVVFDEAGSPVRVRLTAVDSAGEEHVAERTVTVEPYDGNAPPQVTIDRPENLLSGQFAITALSGDTVTYEASVADFEDAPEDLEVRWDFVAIDGAGNPDPSLGTATPATISGERSVDVVFASVLNVAYRGTFTARDSGGKTASRSVDVFVFAEPEP